MNQTRSVGLLFGGESPEHEVSIVTARAIAEHLDPARFEVRPMGIARNGVWAVLGDPFARLEAGEQPERSAHPFLPLERGAEDAPLPDLFFNALHGAGGEDGQIQGYLELLHRPYTGAGLLAMAAGMDKWITKRLWESHGLPVVPYEGLTEERWTRERAACLAACARLGLPLFVKPANLGSRSAWRRSSAPRTCRRPWTGPSPLTGGCWWSKASRSARSRWRCWAAMSPWCPWRAK